jgi:hypothetical protein
MVHLPLSPTLLLTWHCKTIIDRLNYLISIQSNDHLALRTYGEGLRTGQPIKISDAEVERYNALQFAQSRRFLFSHADDFDDARVCLAAKPEAGLRESLVHLRRVGEELPPRPQMPDGWHLVVHGPHDHCMLHLLEIDEEGEGITAQTNDLVLLNAAAAEAQLSHVELFEGPIQYQHLGKVKLELLCDRGPGWFRAVHYDESIRTLDRQIRAG